jgi:branched-chain amino acid transport system ATP-binding protein
MLAVRDLHAGYGSVPVLRGATLDVNRGELVTLVGPNGAGKSTLLRALTGVVPARAGRVELDGVALHRLPPEVIVRHGVVMVPEGRELFGPLAVRANLTLGAWATPRAGRRRRMADDLDRVLALFPALRPRLAQPVSTLSGGEQQMVAIGRALMARPRLLLLDEPSVGLAPLVIRAIFEVLARLRAEGLTMLLVEQNARAAFRIADRGYALVPGGAIEPARVGPGADGARGAYGFVPLPEEAPS